MRQRQRNGEQLEEHKTSAGSSSSSKRRSRSGSEKESGGKIYFSAGLVAVVAVAYFVWQGYLETRVNTALDYPKVVRESGLDVPDRFWGSYRPGVYFGITWVAPLRLLG